MYIYMCAYFVWTNSFYYFAVQLICKLIVHTFDQNLSDLVGSPCGLCYAPYAKCECTGMLKISIKNFKGFRNVRKSIETSGDISVLWPITFLWGSEVLAKSHGVHSGPLHKGFRTSDPRRMWLVKVLRCHHLFLRIFGHSKSLEIFNECALIH